MKLKLGIIAPFILEIGILLLYTSIRYEEIDRAILVLVVLLMFPVFLAYVFAQFLITYRARLEKEITERLDIEFDKLLGFEHNGESSLLEDSRVLIQENMNLHSEVGESIKGSLIPILTERSLALYKDTYYSRETEIKQEKSLEYFEALSLFSIFTTIFFALDLITVWIMGITSVDLYFITLELVAGPAL